MKLYETLDLGPKAVVALVGGGGKTSAMFRLAEEIPSKHSVLITTTTKIYIPSREEYHCFCTQAEGYNEEAVVKALKAGERPVLGSRRLYPEHKLDGVEEELLAGFFRQGQADYILVEADGSKGRPLKGHLDYEPVIPGITTCLLIVIGADVLGKQLDSQFVHRPEIVAGLTGQRPGTMVGPETIACLINHPWGILRTKPAGAETVAIINKIDCLKSLDEVYRTARLLLVGGRIRKVILSSIQSTNPVIDIIE
ncbi:MAG: selenium cofactor biosynthesis protein YqeC [Syntrophomonas sp.]